VENHGGTLGAAVLALLEDLVDVVDGLGGGGLHVFGVVVRTVDGV